MKLLLPSTATRFRLLTAAMVGGMVLGLVQTSVQAQTLSAPPQIDQVETILPTDSPDSTVILERQSLQSDITQSQASLRGQILEYRTAEREFVIAREQWLQLNTLASLETAVVKTKEVMRLRNLVLKTHFTLLKLHLIEARGIPLPDKEEALRDVEFMLAEFDRQQTLIDQVVDRQSAYAAAQNFLLSTESIEVIHVYANNLLTLSRLQTLYDKTQTLVDKVSAQTQSSASDLRQGEKQRALAETRQQLLFTNQNLEMLKLAIKKTDGKFPPDLARTSEEELTATYNGLAQVHRYIGELLTL